MRHIVLFPDTNIFLQCKTLQELPWAAFDVDRVDLLIGAPVQDEIDRLKQDGNHRRARRARETNGLFREVLESNNETLIIRESGPRVLLSFAPALPPKRTTPETLDPTRADDRLIAEVLHFREQDLTAKILTGDTGMRLRSRRHEVPVFAITEAWALPPENDDRDKEIRLLRKELDRFEEAEPVLALLAMGPEGKPAKSISTVVPFYPALSVDQIVRFLDAVQTRYPKTQDFGLTPPRAGREVSLQAIAASVQEWQAPRKEEIEEYRKTYDEWIGKAHHRFERLAFLRNLSTRILPLQLELRNTGSRPADEVIFKVTSHSGLKFYMSEDNKTPRIISQMSKLATEVVLNSPPTAPKGKFVVSAFASFARAAGFDRGILNPDSYFPRVPALPTPVFNRDRHTFYRQDDKSGPVTGCSFSRSEFQHHGDPHVFRIWLLVPPDIAPARSHLHCRVSARNLTKPLHVRIPISLEYDVRETTDVANRWSIKRAK